MQQSISMRSPALCGRLSVLQAREFKNHASNLLESQAANRATNIHSNRMPKRQFRNDSTGSLSQKLELHADSPLLTGARSISEKMAEKYSRSDQSCTENQKIASELLMRQNSIPNLFKVYMNHRSKVDVIASSICLARLAAIWRPNSNDVDLIANSGATKILLTDITTRLLSYAHKPGTPRHKASNAIDPRMLGSIVYSLGKLTTPLRINAQRELGPTSIETSNVHELAHSLMDLCLQLSKPQLPQFPPRSLAMFTWGVSRMNVRDAALYQKISELMTSGICKVAPAYIPPILKANRQPATLREFTSPFVPSELALLCTAFAMTGVKDHIVYDKLASMITSLLPYCPHNTIASFTWAMTSSLSGHQAASAPASNISSTGSISSRSGLGAITSSNGTATSTRDSSKAKKEFHGNDEEDSSALKVEGRLRFLFHIAEEMSIRLILADEGNHVGVKNQSKPATSNESTVDEIEPILRDGMANSADLRGIDALDSNQRVALVLSRLRNNVEKEDEENVDDTDAIVSPVSEESYNYPERKKAFSAQFLASLLHSFASANLRPPQLFGQAAKYLSGVSATSGSDSSGMHGFRAAGTHPDDDTSSRSRLLQLKKSLAKRKNKSFSILGTEMDNVPSNLEPKPVIGDVAIVSTLDSNTLSSVAWSFAKSRFESPYTHTMWAAIQATFTHRMNRLLESQCANFLEGEASPDMRIHKPTYRRSDFLDITPAHVGTLMWSSATASISAVPLAKFALEHLRSNTAAYSIPSLAQVLWGSALQGVYCPDATVVALEHVMHVAAYKRAERLGQIPFSPSADKWNSLRNSSSRLSDPDSSAEYLIYGSWTSPSVESRLSSRADGQSIIGPPSGASRIAGQLYTVLMGLYLEGESKGISKATIEKVLGIIPVEVQQGWRNARLSGEYKMGASSSRLHKDVARVLAAAKTEFSNEYVTPEGLLVDIFIEEPERESIGFEKSDPLQSAVNYSNSKRRSVAFRRSNSAANRQHTSKTGVDSTGFSSTSPAEEDSPEVIDLFNPLAPSSSNKDNSNNKRKQFAIEVQGPSHFTRGIDVAQGLRRAVDGGATLASVASFKPTDMMIHASDSDATIPLGAIDVQLSEGDHLSTIKHALVPTLRTRAKLSWLQASGFTPITIDFAEWASVPSTQEKLELLLEKGLPIDERYI